MERDEWREPPLLPRNLTTATSSSHLLIFRRQVGKTSLAGGELTCKYLPIAESTKLQRLSAPFNLLLSLGYRFSDFPLPIMR